VPNPDIDPEKLAALLDGRLPDAERQELLSRVADSPEDMALLADARIAMDDAVAAPTLTPQRRRWRVAHAGWMAAAAGIVAVVSVALLSRRDGADVLPLPANMPFALWGAVRGGLAAPPSSDSARAWRVGVRLADLDAAIAAQDGARTADFAREIAALLNDGRFGLAWLSFETIADSAMQSARPARLRELSERGRRQLGPPLDTAVVGFARWAEEARFAARRANTGFFQSPATTRGLSRLDALPWDSVSALRSSVDASDWRRTEELLAGLLSSAGR
jgi:hypothetical protein